MRMGWRRVRAAMVGLPHHSLRGVAVQQPVDRRLAAIPVADAAGYRLSTANIMLGQAQKAIAYAETAMRVSPRDPQLFLFHFQKGVALLLLSENDQAIDWLHRVVAAAPHWPIPFALLAQALAQQNRKAEAETALSRYLSLTGFRNSAIAQWRAQLPSDDPAFLDGARRIVDGLRKAGMSEA